MSGIWFVLGLIVVGGICLAAGIAQNMSGLFVVGFAALALAGILGSKGRFPESRGQP